MELAPPSPAIHNASPLVTVVVPCFGEGRYLDDCLHSVRAQTYPHLEVLVIDDAGSDDSWAVGLEHALADDRVELLRTHENVGLGAIRNLGIRKARGDLLLFLDGDDWMPLDAVQNRVEALANHLDALDKTTSSRVAGVFGDWQHAMFSAGPDHPTRPSRQLTPVDLATSRGSNVFIVSAPLTRRDILLHSGGFAEGVKGGEDHLGWMRVLAMDTLFVPCEHLVAFYRQKQSSMLRSSAETVAAFAVTTRRWVEHRASALPSHGHSPILPSMKHPDAGEFSVLWGRPRVQLTRVAAVGVVGDVAALPRATPTESRTAPDLGATTDMAADIAFAERFLAGETSQRRSPSVTHLRHTSGALALELVDGDATGRLPPGPPDHITHVVIRAETLHEGFEAGAIAIALRGVGVHPMLDLTLRARTGVTSALVLSPDLALGITILTGQPPAAPCLVVRSAASDKADAGMFVERFDPTTPTPGSELLADRGLVASGETAALVPSGSADIEALTDWIQTAEHVVSATHLNPVLTTFLSATSRLLADEGVPHRHGGIADLAQARAVLCQDSETAELARMANAATIWLTAESNPRSTTLQDLVGSSTRRAAVQARTTAQIVDRILDLLGSDAPH